MNKKSLLKKKSKNGTTSKKGILRNNINQENFANHTISSAIKADYALPDVKYKLDELNTSVKKTRIVKTAPSVNKARKSSSKSQKPFVVRKVTLEI